MSVFKYLPELSVELSSNAPVGLKFKGRTDNWNEKTFILDAKDKNAKYVDFVDKDRFGVIQLEFSPYGNEQFVFIIPNKEVNKKLYEKFGFFTVCPVVLPPSLKTTDEIVQYVVDRNLIYDYNSGFPPNGFKMEPHISYNENEIETSVFNRGQYLSRWAKVINGQLLQKKILHAIVFNEFLAYAEKQNNYKITLGEFLSNSKNVDTIKDKFTRFELTKHSHRKIVKRYFIENFGPVSSPLKYNILSTVPRRETNKNLTAMVAFNIIVAGSRSDREYPYDNYDNSYWGKFKVEVKSNTYGIEEVLENTFASLSNDDSIGFNFNGDNVIASSNVFLGSRVNSIIQESDNDLSDNDKNEILTLSKSLYDMIEDKKWVYRDSLSTIYNALGYEYLSTEIRPTNLAAICRLFNKPSQTLRSSSYLNNISAFIANNLANEKDLEMSLRAKNYVCDFIYEIVMHNNDIVAYKDMLSMDFSSVTNEYSNDTEEVSPAMIGNILFTNNNFINDNRYIPSKEIKRLRTLGF